MPWPKLQSWFNHRAAPASGPASPSRAPPPAMATPQSLANTIGGSGGWPPSRLAVTNALWGEGFQFPGGERETLRLAKPLGLSAAASLLLVGAGSGGPPCCVANNFGVWVTGFEADATLVALGSERSIRSGLGRRAQIESWRPEAPDFGRSYYHHGLVLEALRDGNFEPVLTAIATALKPGGQLTLVETTADNPLDPRDVAVSGWSRLDHRSAATVPSQATVTRMLSRLGFEVRIVEDVSQRHIQQALLGWRQVVGGLENLRPSARQVGPLIDEAELWLLQMRLFGSQKLRRIRWLAIGRTGG